MTQKIRASIVGGAGYTAGELLGILKQHPSVEIVSVMSTSNAGNPISSVHTDLVGEVDFPFTENVDPNSDVVFLCLGHGHSEKYLKENSFSAHTKIIDFSNEFRISPHHVLEDKTFVYGLPELSREQIKNSNFLANPGCFATAIQLALLPMAKQKRIKNDIHVSAVTGSTGAGQSLIPTTGFTWRNNNASFYKEFSHQHEAEIYQTLQLCQENLSPDLYFLPSRGDFARGILAGVYFKTEVSLEEAKEIYKQYYQDEPFVFVSDTPIDLKQVVNTNKCLLHLQKQKDILFVTSVIDNLTKGAAGQAVQNMNLMFGLEETLGLNLKSVKF
ncbi:MAG: N-acetyl-gamma-glutamyl-phosphate reductase [Flavobacteriaceae bacterium]|nr:MAG: N-acetyl-gamma-glutamyl-phosphate reductase [Flavobacteriaceae bacterium]